MNPHPWVWLPVAAMSTSVYATTYLTTEQAQQAIFPGEQLTPAFATLTDEQAKQLDKMTDVNVRHKEIKAWKTASGAWFVLDEVVGKHEFITYAIGLNADGSVKQIEILDYRESYGYEVRNPEWRKQFVGKTSADPLKLAQDIRNISGATLSCRHITDGVKRVLATHAVALK
jgi:Na+-translocating ferredoxin:NAD+ oxidoreductase RnfG subunit